MKEGMVTMSHSLEQNKKVEWRGTPSLLPGWDPCLTSPLAGCCLLWLEEECAPGTLRADGVLAWKQDLT